MWRALVPRLERPVELHELRGFGETPAASGRFCHAEDLEPKLPAALVGASYGGQVCLEVAARRPELVGELVLLNAPLPDHDWSREVVDYAAQEERLLAVRDVEAATALNVRFWTGAASAAVQELVAAMQRRALELQLDADAEEIEPESIDLAAIRARTLVVWGDRDHADFGQIGERLGHEIHGAETAVIKDAGHLPALERPVEVAALLKGFLRS